jgi:hypothetical protein
MARTIGSTNHRCPITGVNNPQSRDTKGVIDERYIDWADDLTGATVRNPFDTTSCTITDPRTMCAVFDIHPRKYKSHVVPWMERTGSPVASDCVYTVDGYPVCQQAANDGDLRAAGEAYRADLSMRRTAHLQPAITEVGAGSSPGITALATMAVRKDPQ